MIILKHRCCEECETSFHRCYEKTVPDLRLPVSGRLCWLVNIEGIFKVPVRFTVVYGNMKGYVKCYMWDLYKENKYLSLIFSFWWFPNFPKRLFDIRLSFALFVCQTLFCLSSCLHCSAAAESLQSCPTLCDPIDGSPPGSPVPGSLQARTLEWVAISFSSAWKWNVNVKSLSRVWLLATPWTAAYQAPLSMGFSRQEDWSGCQRLLLPLH